MNLFRRRIADDQIRMNTERENKKFLDSLHNKTQLSIKNESIKRWIVRGDCLYFSDWSECKLVVYSLEQRRVVQEMPHEDSAYDFVFVSDNFLVSAGADFLRVWSSSDGTLQLSKEFEFKSGYISSVAVSSTSFLYIAEASIRQLDLVVIPHSKEIYLAQVNGIELDCDWIRPSEICGGKVALVFRDRKKISIFDVTAFKFTAQLDLSPHLTEGFELDNCMYRRFDVAFPDCVVLCVGDSAHSKLKILILDAGNLNVRKSFVVSNPIHFTLEKYSTITHSGILTIGANKSKLRMQYFFGGYNQILDISIDEERITSSYGFHSYTVSRPNRKSLSNGVIVVDKDGHLIYGDTENKIRGSIEKLYNECIQSGRRASYFCDQLSPHLFDGSLFQFYCAHRLLMMAIQDGDVDKSLHHNGVDFKWHELIYSASRNLRLETREDKNELKMILKEAVKFNVIESVSQYLLANEIVSEVREQNKGLFNMEKQLFMRLVQLEVAHMKLERAFERYRKVQGMTELMGVALNIIPFLGGSIAAAVTAGADLIEGLQVSDVISGSLQVSVDTISNSSTFEKGVLKCVENSLRKQEIEKSADLLRSLDNCGVTIDELKDILENGFEGNEDMEDRQKIEPTSVGNTARTSGGTSVCDSDIVDGEAVTEELPTEIRILPTIKENPDQNIDYQESDSCNASSKRKISNTSSPKLDLSYSEQWKLSEYRKLNNNRSMVSLLSIRQCSFFIASLMLQFDDDLEDEFRELQPVVFGIIRRRMISGKVLCDFKRYSSSYDNKIDEILSNLKKSYPVNDIMAIEFIKFVKN